ncbi:MAG: UDP-N-acetylglucosamine 2-epimerase (non-hydrolyzing) [Fimbriimonadaceae bacterium]|nr:UDP-N-acetylglucosamine 2-epimerase (non-hydrolyzing) [Fimbriimonadaceae bacterium]QYK56959.1 MAG: UDP-N-acetylglucosamine 2-epimerase (non-hydrolyzing) [Fimbriimonadaceae bacterium]
MARPVVAFVVGTRPDAIKTAPVVLEACKFSDLWEPVLISTGQHREMLRQALGAFGLEPDEDLQVMTHGQTLAQVTSRSLDGLDGLFRRLEPQIVFAQGDTTTTFVAGLAAFYHRRPFAHIEAGLRTPTVWDPYPEEFNRRAVGLFASLHFAPTEWSRDNLLREGAAPQSVFVTGNTGIDAVKLATQAAGKDWFPEHTGPVVLLTTHRRENWGDPQRRIAEAALEVVRGVPDALLVVPMHLNPAVRETLTNVLGGDPRIHLIEPPDYVDFARLMARSRLILTDSGGVQEEAPTLGVPVLVLRETTERPEGVEAGTAKLVGTEKDKIVQEAMRLLGDSAEHERMARASSPYGDGKAAQRIRYASMKFLGLGSPEEPAWK